MTVILRSFRKVFYKRKNGDKKRNKNCDRIGVSGGVSANKTFVEKLMGKAKSKKIRLFSPSVELCGDNAAMIAARGYTMIQQGSLCDLDHDVFSRSKID